MVTNLPLVSGIPLLSALMEYHTLAPGRGWCPTKSMCDEGLIFKGISKGLIHSDAIGVDFYKKKKIESHKEDGATCLDIKITKIRNEKCNFLDSYNKYK